MAVNIDTLALPERVKIAGEITKLFSLERYVYISCCGVAVLLLLANAGMVIYEKRADSTELALLFGSSGLITYSMGRLIYMWNKIVDLTLGGNSNAGNQ
jgi:predicted membrane channel-forming protein YqfA (hemolysin III family)